MFPKNSDSARGKELQAKLPAVATDLAKYPLPTKDDYALVGAIIRADEVIE